MADKLQKSSLSNNDETEINNQSFSRLPKTLCQAKWNNKTLLLGVILIASMLRLWSLAWGWRYNFYGDETLYMPNALRMLADRNINTGNFHNSHLLTNICAMAVAAFGALGLISGVFNSLEDFGQFVWNELPLWRMFARIIVAAFGTATVLLTYKAGTYVTSKSGALISALILALSPLHIYYSKIGVNDVVMVFFVTATIYLALKYQQHAQYWHFFWLGVLSGLSAGSKYNGGMVILVPALVAILCFARYQYKWSWLVTALALLVTGTVFGFCISNPAAFIYPNDFIAGFERQRHYGKSPWPTQSDSPVPLLMISSFTGGMGYVPLMLGFVGAISGLRIDHKKILLLVIFVACYTGYMLSQRLFFPRFMLPVYPVLAILAGSAVVTLARRIANRRNAIVNNCVKTAVWTTAITILMALEPSYRSFCLNRVLGRGDTREIVSDRMREFLGHKNKILADFDASAGMEAYKDRIELQDGQPPEILEGWSVERIKSSGFDYVMLSSQWRSYCRWDHAANKRYSTFAKEIDAEFTLVMRVSPYSPAFVSLDSGAESTDLLGDLFNRSYSGPTIYIYKVLNEDL